MLLRVLQEHEFERLGGSNTLRANVRILAATNRDLAEQVRAGRFREDIARIERRIVSLLESYDWPGNVRELENMIERAVILSRNGILQLNRHMLSLTGVAENLDEELQARERETIDAALRASRGRVAGPNGAAKRLGLAPSTLEFRIRRLGIDRSAIGEVHKLVVNQTARLLMS